VEKGDRKRSRGVTMPTIEGTRPAAAWWDGEDGEVLIRCGRRYGRWLDPAANGL